MKNERQCQWMLLLTAHTWPFKDQAEALQAGCSLLKQKRVNRQTLRSRVSRALEHNKHTADLFLVCCQGVWLIHQEKSNYQALQLLSLPQPVTALSPILSGMSPQGTLPGSARSGHRCPSNLHRITLLLTKLLTEAS